MTDAELLTLAVSTAQSGILVADAAGRIVFANSAAEGIAGRSGRLLGALLDDVLPGAADTLVQQAPPSTATELIPRLPAHRSLEARRPDGSLIPVDVDFSPATHDGQSITLVTMADRTDRRALERELADRQALERTLAEIAAGFVGAPDDKVDDHIVASQARLASMLGVDRCSLWQPTGDEFFCTHVWTADPDIPLPAFQRFGATEHYPWTMQRMAEGRTVSYASLDDVPSETDRENFRRVGARSGAVVPLLIEGRLVGVLTFATLFRDRIWSEYALQRLPIVAAVFASAMGRAEARRALEAAHAEVQRLRDQLATENVQLRKEVRTLKGPRVLATQSPAAQEVLTQIEQVAPTTATVLLLGETGSGKEVFAETLHELSPRRNKPMVRVNCAAIPTALIESELFGRERGAYTGAITRELGRFEVADGSTIFLDEVGELPLDVQVKLLRVLQDRVIERLGSTRPIKVDVRVIAATNRDLDQAVADKTFREDLYYRLNVFPIRVPPLRERVEDIPTLAWAFISEFATAFGKDVASLSKASLQALQAYSWPGNVRELRNVVERALIVARGPHLVIDPPAPSRLTVKRTSLKFADVEADHIRAVIESTGWRIRGRGGAAELLGLKPTTLESRMAKLGIVRSGTRSPAAATPGAPPHAHRLATVRDRGR